MKRETKKPLNKQRCIVAYLDGLQAKVNALRELPYPSLRDTLPKYDIETIHAH